MAELTQKDATSTTPFIHEFDIRKRVLEEEVPYIKELLDAVSPIPGLEEIYKYGRLTQTDLNHAIINQGVIDAGRGKNFQKTFERFYRDVDFPKTDTPSKIGLFIFEDTPKQVTPETPYVHAHGVTAYSQAAAHAMGGNLIDAVLVNRLPLADDLGQHWTATSKNAAGGDHRESSYDMAQFLIRHNFRVHDANVVSVSLVSNDPSLVSAEERKKDNEKMTRYFGDNTVFVVASGNGETQKNPSMKHNALRHHPNTILIGAANAWDTIGADGQTNNSYSLAHYSTPGPDIVMTATPNEALYAGTTPDGVRHTPIRGTSLATPQAAAGIAKLLQRFTASENNPEAVLSVQDVLLAAKNTANPLHTVIHDQVSYNTKAKPAIETRNGRSSNGIAVFGMNGNYTSLQAGNGMFDPQAAWELLEKQEQEVHAGREKILPRQNVSIDAKQTTHTMESTAGRKRLPANAPQNMYRYNIEVTEDLKSDQLNLELMAKDVSRKLVKNTPNSRPRFFLVNPKGNTVEVAPSANYSEFTDHLGNRQSESKEFLMARATGMQGSAMKGTWTLLSTDRIDNITMNFDHAMSPEHVAARILPNPEERKKQLFKAADLSAYKEKVLNDLVKPNSYLFDYDISQTGFPPGFTELKLAEFAASDKATAKKLLKARFHTHPSHEQLAAAIETANQKTVIETLIPEEKRYDFIKNMAVTGSKEDLMLLVNNGFADLKDPNAPEGAKPSTALIQVVGRRGDKMEVDLLDAFLKQGVDAHYQDEKGRSVLHYATDNKVQSKLINIDINGPAGTRMLDLKDKDGKVYHEIPWNDRKISMMQMQAAPAISMMYADADNSLKTPNTQSLPAPVQNQQKR